MAGSNYHGTLTSKLKPIVTMLTEALARDFAPAYRRVPVDYDLYIRTDESGHEDAVDGAQLRKDVESWLLTLEEDMTNDSDRQFAKMVVNMIRKNPGWVTLLANRVQKRIR